VPATFAHELHEQLGELAKGSGSIAEGALDTILGKAGRLAYIVPACRPFVTALWGALSGSTLANSAGRRREAPPGRHAARRFAAAARWLRILLKPPLPTDSLLHLETVVSRQRAAIDPTHACIQCDASLWGGGSVLFVQGRAREYICTAWSEASARRLGVEIGSAEGQTAWEYLILFLSLLCWADSFRDTGVACMGDNLASLSGILAMKGKSNLTKITRELAWRKCRQRWHYSAGHLPSERNTLADALSRVSAPSGADAKAFPEELLRVPERKLPQESSWWACED